MKKTFKVQFPIAQAYIQTPMSCGTVQEPMMDFAGQDVTITVESAEPEKEKSKVQMCESFCGCRKPARWKIDGSDIGRLFYSCDEHVHRALSYAARTYTITPIPPQPPAPVVVDDVWDDRPGHMNLIAGELVKRGYTNLTMPIPHQVLGKRFRRRFTEIPD